MRSLYSPNVTDAILCIIQTTHPEDRPRIRVQDIQPWLSEIETWDGLEILLIHE